MKTILTAGLILMVLTACGGASTTYSYEDVQYIDGEYRYDPYSFGIYEGIVVINETPVPIYEVVIDGIFYYSNPPLSIRPDHPFVVDMEIVPGRLYDVIIKFTDGNINVIHFMPEWSGVYIILVPWYSPSTLKIQD